MAFNLTELLRECKLCPRGCGVNRSGSHMDGPGKGYCGQGSKMKVAYVGPHLGEEPPISGARGAGTVFFTGCSLRCSYCQNHQISHSDLGEEMEPRQLCAKVINMFEQYGVHNLSFVTPDHFFPHVFETITLVRDSGYRLPIVMNMSGYQSVNMLRMAERVTDIYLPDFKYADKVLAKRFSHCPDYPEVALSALDEMVRQKGFLQIAGGQKGIAKKGVLVRHLILPGHVDNSVNALTMLFVEFGSKLPISIMSQYYPVRAQKYHELNRMVRREEFDQVLNHAKDLGFEMLFVQFPRQKGSPKGKRPRFLPDFTYSKPFG